MKTERYAMALVLVLLSLALLGLVQANSDQADFRFLQSNSSVLLKGTNTYAQAYNYGQTHPTRDGVDGKFKIFINYNV
jgi:hypothetical protein